MNELGATGLRVTPLCVGTSPLPAAALQFLVRAPFIDSTIVGISSPERVGETVSLSETPIPEELWVELDTLAPGPEMWLDPPR